jgi:hypothetical protein
MLPELEGVVGEEAWRLREILLFAVAADQVDAACSHPPGNDMLLPTPFR